MRNTRSRVVELDHTARFKTLRQCRILKGLKPEGIRELVPLATPVQYAKGAYIFHDGDPAEFLYFAGQGLIKLHKGSASGKNVTFVIATIGDTLNAAALSVKKHFLSAQAMTEATVLRIPRKEFWAFEARHPVIALNIIDLVAEGLEFEYNRIVDIIGAEVELRVVHSLFTLALKFGPNLRLKREELANYAGTTTETAIRILSKLRKKGIVSSSAGRGAIVISDISKLQNYKR
ncbi:MAG: transcriptional regulator, Crp/Fnr family [Acidobacteria bacterium]|nr:transcriptional regulator, Crp/Fnr family [Acidobacteriota bacterium]